jgi:hypothetical protein
LNLSLNMGSEVAFGRITVENEDLTPHPWSALL